MVLATWSPRLEPHAVGVAVIVRTRVDVAVRPPGADLAEDDDPGRAAVDAQSATGAHVVVDDEHHVVAGVVAGLLGVGRPRRSPSGVTMWMHFHGQMSTQPSHMMHSD